MSKVDHGYREFVPGGERGPGDGFGEVLYYFEWWDCPRLGAAEVAGQVFMFDSPFDEGTDDYAREFRLWPISDEEVSEDLQVWRAFARWRGRFDAGARLLRPFEKTRASRLHRQRGRREAPEGAQRAVPEWRLDPDRSFAGRVPRHRVRWQFVD